MVGGARHDAIVSGLDGVHAWAARMSALFVTPADEVHEIPYALIEGAYARLTGQGGPVPARALFAEFLEAVCAYDADGVDDRLPAAVEIARQIAREWQIAANLLMKLAFSRSARTATRLDARFPRIVGLEEALVGRLQDWLRATESGRDRD